MVFDQPGTDVVLFSPSGYCWVTIRYLGYKRTCVGVVVLEQERKGENWNLILLY